MKVKLLPNILFHHDVHLMVFRPRGIITEKRVRAIVEMLDRIEDAMERPFNRFTDLSKADAIDLDFQTIFQVSLHRRLAYSRRSPVKSAFYVTSEAAARIVKIHALLTDYSPLKIKMFEDIHGAAHWLGLPFETLQLDTSDASPSRLKKKPRKTSGAAKPATVSR